MSTGTGPSNGGGQDVDSREPEPTVLVDGPVGRLLWTVAVEMIDGRACADDGAVVVTTRESPGIVAERLAGDAGLDRDNLALIDCRGTGEGEVDVGHLRRVDPRADPDTLESVVSRSFTALDEQGVECTHFLFDTLASGYRLPEPAVTYDRAHDLAMTVGTETGIGVFTADTGRLPEDVVEELAHLFDVRVDLRRPTRTTELRWEGLIDASDGWVPLAEVDLRDGVFK